MSDDFYKGMRNDSSDVSNHAEFNRGLNYQLDANAAKAPTAGPHGSGGISIVSRGPGLVITGEHWILRSIASIPFLVIGTLLYPITAALTVVAGLLCVRLVPLFGPDATW
jgi:hypothetical protein